jgi:hypothetical protein
MLGRIIQAALGPTPHVFPVLCRTSQKVISDPKRVRVAPPSQRLQDLQEIITKEAGIAAQAVAAHRSAHSFIAENFRGDQGEAAVDECKDLVI